MKKLITVLSCLLILVLCLSACGEAQTQPTAEPGQEPGQSAQEPAKATPVPEKITEKTDYVTEQWIAVEIPFKATEAIKKDEGTVFDVTFTNRSTGTKLVMPGFWDGDDAWKVRFAPTECGIWDFATTATGNDLGLGGKTGTLAANPYTGDLEIYKHGFIRTQENTKYFVYDDGIPFFYMGDTHWNMVTEEFDTAGKRNAGIETDSHFKYIVDRRVAQGFTVYQSEPIGMTYDVTDGLVNSGDIKGFQKMDQYFAYIAEKGLVHANAQLIFPSSMTDKFRDNMKSLTRYWIARYAAYPVLWTLGQEVDDASNQEYDNLKMVYINMCDLMANQDPYHHPTGAHQLNTSSIGCKGGVPVAGVDGGYNDYDPTNNERTNKKVNKQSAFYHATGRTWWAAQWRPCVDQQYNFGLPKDYWENGKNQPTIDYEPRYEYLYTKENGARIQGWIALLCGMTGVAYGGADMWLYQGTYAQDSEANDGIDTITVEEKRITWGELINAPISDQFTRMRGFFEAVGWWKLEPDFDYGKAFVLEDTSEVFYAAAHTGNSVYVVYLYNLTQKSAGKLVGMDDNATYTAQWFNPVTGQYSLISDAVKPEGGSYTVPEKPAAQDMVLLVTKNV